MDKVCVYMHRGDALWWTTYMMLIGYTIYTKLGGLVDVCTI